MYIMCTKVSNQLHLNKTKTKEKTQLKIETLKAILVTKTNVDMNCSEFYSI